MAMSAQIVFLRADVMQSCMWILSFLRQMWPPSSWPTPGTMIDKTIHRRKSRKCALLIHIYKHWQYYILLISLKDINLRSVVRVQCTFHSPGNKIKRKKRSILLFWGSKIVLTALNLCSSNTVTCMSLDWKPDLLDSCSKQLHGTITIHESTQPAIHYGAHTKFSPSAMSSSFVW
jgi:hypothetical protein